MRWLSTQSVTNLSISSPASLAARENRASLHLGTVLALVVPIFAERGIAHPAWFFSANAVAVIGLRMAAARALDAVSPAQLGVIALVVQLLGLAVLATAETQAALIVAGLILGSAWAAVVPVGLSLFEPHASRGERGAVMGAYGFALALGVAGGGPLQPFAPRLAASRWPAPSPAREPPLQPCGLLCRRVKAMRRPHPSSSNKN